MTGTEYMKECLTKDLVLLLMERRHMDMETALDTLYTSDTFAKLNDSRTGLYFSTSMIFWSMK